jgi:hypothetical protein
MDGSFCGILDGCISYTSEMYLEVDPHQGHSEGVLTTELLSVKIWSQFLWTGVLVTSQSSNTF